MLRFGFCTLLRLTRSLWFALAMVSGSASASDFSLALQGALQNEPLPAAESGQSSSKSAYELLDKVAIAYLHAMLAQDNFKAAHAQIHAVVMQRNLIRRHFFNGKDLSVELAQSRSRIGTLLAQWIAAREQMQQQRRILSTLTNGRVSEVAGAPFAFIPDALSSNSPESKFIQQAIQLNNAETTGAGVDLEALRLYQTVQISDSQLTAYQSAMMWGLEALEGISRAQDSADHPHTEMLEAMATVQQAQNDLFKSRYDNLYQRIRLCAQSGMAPEAIAAHIDTLLTGSVNPP